MSGRTSHPTRFGVRVRATSFRSSAEPSSASRSPAESQRAIWKLLDAGGVDHLWTVDHIAYAGRADPSFDSWTELAMIAEATSRARLGVLVTGTLWRHPALLAKIATTIDWFSNGRLEIGLGATNAEVEFGMLGLRYPSPRERIGSLDESCSVLKALWTQERANFSGTYFQLRDLPHEPKPVQQPHPPIWIGGYGAKGTLRVAAKHAAVWNCSGGRGFEATVEANRLLDTHCGRMGRDPATIRRSVQINWSAAIADECYALTERYIREGFTEFVVEFADDDVRATTEAFLRDGLTQLRGLG